MYVSQIDAKFARMTDDNGLIRSVLVIETDFFYDYISDNQMTIK